MSNRHALEGGSVLATAAMRGRWRWSRPPTGISANFVGAGPRAEVAWDAGWRRITPDEGAFLQPLISGQFARRAYGRANSGAAGQLRRRGPKPSAAYALRRSTSSRPCQPLRRGRAGGKTSMARPWSHTCGHAGDHGVRTANMECTRLWAAGGQVRLARPPRGDGGRRGKGSEK